MPNRERAQNPAKQPTLDQLTELDNLRGNLSHDQKWAALEPADARLARDALAKANELRGTDADPGDAYLQGVADAVHAKRRQTLIEDTLGSLNRLPETPEVDSHS